MHFKYLFILLSCLATWPEWTRQLTPGGFWLVFIRAIGAGQLGAPTPPGSWMATVNSDLSRHNLTFEDAIELALDKSLWRLLVASGATHWHGVWRIMMMMMMVDMEHLLLSLIARCICARCSRLDLLVMVLMGCQRPRLACMKHTCAR